MAIPPRFAPDVNFIKVRSAKHTQRASFAVERLHDNIPVRALRHDGTPKGHRVFLEIENGFIGKLEEHDFRHDALVQIVTGVNSREVCFFVC